MHDHVVLKIINDSINKATIQYEQKKVGNEGKLWAEMIRSQQNLKIILNGIGLF